VGENYMDLNEQVAASLNSKIKHLNFQVSPSFPKGKPGKTNRASREFRLQLINKQNDTSKSLIKFLDFELRKSGVKNLKFNPLSPNSSKYSSYSFKLNEREFDVVITKGANKGENFENNVVKNLGNYFNTRSDKEFAVLIDLMNKVNLEFASREIIRVKQRTGSTRKENVPIEKLGAVIGDIVLTDSANKEWFISLKDINGDTFSSYSGASTIFDSSGKLQIESSGTKFLQAFGADLNKIQEGFNVRNKLNTEMIRHSISTPNSNNLKQIFERAWGMNYFYVRKQTTGWKVFWIDRSKLNELTSNIRVREIKYPNITSKQIRILCNNHKMNYAIEIRNSKGGEYPNDIKFKVLK